MTFEEHVEKLGNMALKLYPKYENFKLYENEHHFYLVVNRDGEKISSRISIGNYLYDDLSRPTQYEDRNDETIVARGDSLSAIEEQLELLEKRKR